MGLRRLVKVQTILRPAAVAAAFNVNTLPASVAVPPVPMPVQAVVWICQKVAGMVSVISVAVLAAVKVIRAPVKVPPAVDVVIVCAVTPLVPVKPKSPVPPLEILRSVSVGSLMLLMVQVEV